MWVSRFSGNKHVDLFLLLFVIYNLFEGILLAKFAAKSFQKQCSRESERLNDQFKDHMEDQRDVRK
jgi:hypothetical protein